jgi:hypothetical protein
MANEYLRDVWNLAVTAGGNALNNVVNQATMTETERIAVRTAETNRWNQINGSGPADQRGANNDAAQGPRETRNPFGSLSVAGVNVSPLLLVAAVVAGAWFFLKRR